MERWFYAILICVWLYKILRWLGSRSGGPMRQMGRDRYEAEFQSVRPYVLARDGYRCKACGWPGTPDNPLQVHHIQYRSRGGTNEMANLVTLCRKHHMRLHSGEPWTGL